MRRLLVLTVLLTGCGVHGLQFHNDKRIHITSPVSRQTVHTPLTVSWTAKDYTPGTDGSFAVFIDRAPMPAGKDLAWLARDDDSCRKTPSCPDTTYLANHGVYVTDKTSVTIDLLPQVADSVGKEQHYVNVVLIDAHGARIGESAWYRAFQSKRRSS